MSSDFYLIGIIPATSEWDNMKELYRLCEETGAEVPEKVLKYFDYTSYENLSEDGMEVRLQTVTNTSGELELLVEEIPKNVVKIKLEISI